MIKPDAVGEWLAFAEVVRQAATGLAETIRIPCTSKGAADPGVVGCALFIRTMSNFDGALRLARERMIVESRVLVRCCIENAICIGALVSDRDAFVNVMKDDSLSSIRTQMTFMERHALIPQEVIRETASQIEANYGLSFLTEGGRPKLSQMNYKGLSEGSAMHAHYVYYKQISADSAHPGFFALGRYVGRLADERVLDFRPSIDPRELAFTVALACSTLVTVCSALDEIVGPLTGAENLQSLMDQIDALLASTGILAARLGPIWGR